MKTPTVMHSAVAMLMLSAAWSIGQPADRTTQVIIAPEQQNGRVYVYTGVAKGKPEGIGIPSLYIEHDCIDKAKPETKQASASSSGCCLKYIAHLDRKPGNCGVAWSKAPRGDAPGVWGETNSIPVWNLQGARKLVVNLRGQRGGEQVQIKVGILGDKPYGDSLRTPIESKWFELTTAWQAFEIAIPDRADLTRVYTPLCWVANDVHQPEGMSTITFYIDDCYFEF
jgi:hypothetical protein